MPELDPTETRIRGQRRRKRLLALVMFPFCLWAGFTWYEQQSILLGKKEDLRKAQQSFDQVKLENEELTYQVNKLHDKEYIAEIARRDYHLSKPGEVIFITPE
ncbi:septum formation initiator family protein [Ammoniphilus sp. CFH 90114]|uniref:FtsB family cell division protein n=1 Tax=Ammoniphilus sp. CFH 90114 TaxID=2493665 RepID=UPI0013E9665E|nr:septum formation initiator family protein [Ammoniphilus sp. CFH 90114]